MRTNKKRGATALCESCVRSYNLRAEEMGRRLGENKKMQIFYQFSLEIPRLKNYLCTRNSMVGIAQLVRVAGCGSVGRGFESHYPPKSPSRKIRTFSF